MMVAAVYMARLKYGCAREYSTVHIIINKANNNKR